MRIILIFFTTLSAYLGKITKWRQDYMASESINGAKYGLWHALTNCFPPPGTVGQAYVGTTCSSSHNTGYSSWSGGLWATYAHEVGHNWGASHTMNTGGTLTFIHFYCFSLYFTIKYDYLSMLLTLLRIIY